MILFQIRRGTDAQRLTVVFNGGEFVYTTDKNQLWIGDGVTAGGKLIGGPGTLGALQGARGTVALGSGVSSVTVSGLGLPSVPAQVLVTVRHHSGATKNLFATVQDDSISTAGFTADLSDPTDATTYKLDYLILL